MINIYKCGTKVILNDNIKGVITGISIRFNNVTYEISYIYDGQHKSEWVYECEFVLGEKVKKEKIGFK